MILRHILGADKRDGFYVDIGAFHPIHASNTYFFYLNGFRGINVDARPGSMELFNKIRPYDINLEFGVSNKNENLNYYFIDENSSMNSFSKEFLSNLGMLKYVKKQIEVPMYTLSEILDKYLPSGKPIDFLNVDVEGFDYNVLVSNDWERYRPKIIVVECGCQDESEARILNYLKDNEYEVCAQNVIIIHKINEYFLIDKRQS